jgi:CheY-like chemotaxis protein
MNTFSKNLLIVDNDVDTVETMHSLFEELQYRVLKAYDGHEAISLAKQQVDSSVILDISLPEMDGFAVARQLRQLPNYTQSTIIGFSGHAGAKYLDQAQSAGMDYYLLKPCDPEILLACLEPEEYPDTLCKHLIATSKQLSEVSAAMLAKGRALSMRSQAAVLRAKTICAKRSNGGTR